jgi:hypothetical protein
VFRASEETAMSLIAFHRFLIVCFILFSLYFAWHMFARWRDDGQAIDLGVGIFFALCVVGFSLYLRTVGKRPRKEGVERP